MIPAGLRFGRCEDTAEDGQILVSFTGDPQRYPALPINVYPSPGQPVVLLSTYDRLLCLGVPASAAPAPYTPAVEISKDDDNGLTVDEVGLIKQPFILRSGSWVGNLVGQEATITFDYIRDGIDLTGLAVFAQIGDTHGFTDYRVQTPPLRRTRTSMVLIAPGAPAGARIRINWLIAGKVQP